MPSIESGIMPQLQCCLAETGLVWTLFITAFMTGLAYFSIAITLWALVRKLSLSSNFISLCVVILIAASGLTHLMEAGSIWKPDHGWSAGIRLVTSVLSIVTSVYLYILKHPMINAVQSMKPSKGQRLGPKEPKNGSERSVQIRKQPVKQSEAIFRQTFERVSIGLAHVDFNFQFIRINPSFCKMTQYEEEELLTRSMTDLIHSEDRKQIPTFTQNLHSCTIETVSADVRLSCKSGDQICVRINASVNSPVESEAAFIIVSIEDISRLKKIQSERELLFALPNQFLCILNREGCFQQVNIGFHDLLGFSTEELIHRSLSDFVHPEDQYLLKKKFQQTPEEIEFRFRAKDGTFYWLRWTGVILDDLEWVVATDVTKMKSIENRLRESEQQLRIYLENAQNPVGSSEGMRDGELTSSEDTPWQKMTEIPLKQRNEQFFILANSVRQLVWIADKKGSSYWYNDRWYEYTGTTLEEMRGWGWLKVHHPDDTERVIKRLNYSWATGKPWEDTFQLKSKSGDWRWFHSFGLPIRDETGNILNWIGIGTDITEQMRSLVNEEQFKTIMQQMPAAVVIGEAPSGKLIFANDKVKEIWGPPFIQTHSIDEYSNWVGFHSDGKQYEGHDWPLARSILKGEVITNEDAEILRGDGKRATLRLCSGPVRDRNGKIIAGVLICQDVTEQITIQNDLKKNEAELQAIFNQAAVGLANVGLDGRWLKVNPKLCEITGYSYEELLSKAFQDITHPDDLRLDVQCIVQLLENEISNYTLEKRYIRKDGTIVWANLTVALVRNRDGSPNYFIAVVEDFSDKKKITEALHELARTLELRVKERTRELEVINQELEQFAYVVSHDLREPLRVVGCYIQLFLKKFQSLQDETSRKYAGYIIEAVQRMDQLILDLLAYSRTGRTEMPVQEFDLSNTVKSVLSNLKASIQECHAQIEWGALPKITAIESQIAQVFQNIIGNAIKYRPIGQTPIIKLNCVDEENQWKFSISDNGIGIDPKYRNKIFLVFQRLHNRKEYPGTGIGLAICKKIIEHLGGNIWVESMPGLGSTFYFTLPKLKQKEFRGPITHSNKRKIAS
jgi:PAS domain S-box-containing protein